jgi:pseudouridine synthase
MNTARMRLNKFLSRAGVASRRAADEMLVRGRVRVNGETIRTPGISVDPETDRVEVDGVPVRIEPERWILLNKPRGVLTTRRDVRGRRTVYSLLDPDDQSLPYVGRLDRDTQGLLLFTNDGDLANRLMHPSSEVEREYRALVDGVVTRETVGRLTTGVELDDGPARAERVRVKMEPGGARSVVSLVVREGRKREIRRLFEAVGHPVHRLKRVALGPLRLGSLGAGKWRELSTGEVSALRALAR